MLSEKLFIVMQYALPKSLLSRLAGKIANSQNVRLKNILIKTIMKKFDISLDDAKKNNAYDYVSFNDFFTRRLKADSRPFIKDESNIISPSDGKVTQYGLIKDGDMIQAKGKSYSVDSLLAEKSKIKFSSFITIYLAPKDYHRVHMPIDGKLINMSYIPGKLFSVNEVTASKIDGLFALNERLVCNFETKIGRLVVVFVGAMLVAGINTKWDGPIKASKDGKISNWDYSKKDLFYNQGDEIGFFDFGSTVICLFEEENIKYMPDLQDIKYGNKLATVFKN